MQFKKLCEPAKIYLVATVIFIVLAVLNGLSSVTLLVKGVFAIIWTLFLNWLCSKGFSRLAWIIIIIPFIFFFLMMNVVSIESFDYANDLEDFWSEPSGPEYVPYPYNHCKSCPPKTIEQKALCDANLFVTEFYNDNYFSCPKNDNGCINSHNNPDEFTCTAIYNRNIKDHKNDQKFIQALDNAAKADYKSENASCLVNGQFNSYYKTKQLCENNPPGGKWKVSKGH
jgi:hypothetical protein